MALPTLTPSSEISAVILPSTGTFSEAQDTTNYAFGIYADPDGDFYDVNFVSGAMDQISFTYKMLGGDVLDIELTAGNVYTAYEASVLEYSYIVNIHQGKNILNSTLGATTGTFDHHGELKSGDLSSSLDGTHVGLKYPKFDYAFTKRVGERTSQELDIGGNTRIYSASFDTNTTDNDQDYDLQSLITSSADFSSINFNNKKVTIKKVFYKTPHAMWRFYGYYGGINTVGNLSTYGMYADDSTFEVIPPWQNKAQAMAYEDAIYTRNSHYSFEIKNNRLRIFPQHTSGSPKKFWVNFTIQEDPWDEESDRTVGVDGVNNLNTIPFGNIPFENINSIGKQWIRRFALALAKEMLGQVRGKFGNSIPIPGDNVSLNATDLLSQAKEEQEKLREELKTVLDELTYSKLAAMESDIANAVTETTKNVPAGIFVG
jgi:hypothetical protein|tara:strand:- start:1955 stop:3244 length:1290 start_codon:yes stop_codon:yes gene_type:complete